MAYNETHYQGETMNNNRFYNNLKTQVEANPILALGVTAALLTAASKLMDSNTARMAAKTHAQEVARRIVMNTK